MNQPAPAAPPLAAAPCFIETQFPVAKVSMESYKERTAKQSQTLTGLGKWWGRKPLILVRAALLGLLLPASDDPGRDREIFLKLLTMDDEGLRRRKSKSIPAARVLQELAAMAPSTQRRFLDTSPLSCEERAAGGVRLRPDLTRAERDELQQLVFDRLPYAEKLVYCDRPEQMDGPSLEAWAAINSHLGTEVFGLPELIEELGRRRFGHRPRVGDAFSGGGSIPFEAARLGCDAYGSDLNPVAALLTWAALNIVGGGDEVAEAVRNAQRAVYEAVDRQITEWGIEHNSLGWRADAYLYCVEVVDPESGWRIPLAPSWVIGERNDTVARLIPDPSNRRYDIEIRSDVSDAELAAARQGTVQDSRLMPPGSGHSTPIEVVRRNLRLWEKEDLVPEPDDIFQERLYCIRWVETYLDADGKERTRHHYRAPTVEDLRREDRALALLRERFDDWQARGFIPSRRIEPGDKTDEPIRTRGWTHWHHLFNPRQSLTLGLLMQEAHRFKNSPPEFAVLLLGISRSADYNSKLCRWHPRSIGDKSEQTFSNQALNTLYNYASRPLLALKASFLPRLANARITGRGKVTTNDARSINDHCEMWITDPPYADAINYHELSEYFLAWQERQLGHLFAGGYTDSRRALAVQGNDAGFRQSMVDSYRRLTGFMPDNGLQIVMFTHQDAAVWADLTMILWAAGLRVTAAWTIATETDSALKEGNYVQGTVLLILRKRTETEPVFLDEITHEVEAEVRRQLDSMLALEDDSDPNFGDADYQLAAYAAALRVLTAQPIEELDPARELLRERLRGEVGPVEQLIRSAVKIACDHLVPHGIERDLWRDLGPAERLYLKGLEVESHGEHRSGVYQELARGFGAADYTDLLANTRANETRLKSASEFGRSKLSGDGFAGTLLRQVLYAVSQTVKAEETRAGLDWLKTELPDYWASRDKIIRLLDYLADLRFVGSMPQWAKDAAAAGLLAGAVRNDHV
jgi:adenine-specific DNA methylase